MMAGSEAPPGAPGAEFLTQVVAITNRRGLHARAAARFVKLAGEFDAEVVAAKDDMSVSGLSIMGLMMLSAGPGTEIELRARGTDAPAVLDALAALVARSFDEDQAR
jgi:phosphocarrier protein HPr